MRCFESIFDFLCFMYCYSGCINFKADSVCFSKSCNILFEVGVIHTTMCLFCTHNVFILFFSKNNFMNTVGGFYENMYVTHCPNFNGLQTSIVQMGSFSQYTIVFFLSFDLFHFTNLPSFLMDNVMNMRKNQVQTYFKST